MLTSIETRGEGGLFLCAPTPGYELVQGAFDRLPVLTEAERELLLAAAWGLNQYIPEPVATPPPGSDGSRPGDEFNRRGDVRAVLRRHGWALRNTQITRPGQLDGLLLILTLAYWLLLGIGLEALRHCQPGMWCSKNRRKSRGVFYIVRSTEDAQATGSDCRASTYRPARSAPRRGRKLGITQGLALWRNSPWRGVYERFCGRALVLSG